MEYKYQVGQCLVCTQNIFQWGENEPFCWEGDSVQVVGLSDHWVEEPGYVVRGNSNIMLIKESILSFYH